MPVRIPDAQDRFPDAGPHSAGFEVSLAVIV